MAHDPPQPAFVAALPDGRSGVGLWMRGALGGWEMTNSVTTYEVFPRLSDKPIQAFESRIDAVQYVTDRRHVVPGLRLFETVTTVTRREIHNTSNIEDELDARAFNRENQL